MRNTTLKLVLAAAIPAIGCGGDTVTADQFDGYGAGHPGAGLVHGGQMFLELIHTPTGDIGMIHAWARNFDPEPILPDDARPIPKIPSGTCMDISASGGGTFPRTPAPGSQYLDLGDTFTVTTEGATHVAPKKTPPPGMTYAFTDNLQFGVPLGYQNNPFDATTIVHDATYNVSFTGSETLEPSSFYFPPRYDIYEPAELGKAPLVFTRGQPLHMAWEPANQDAGGTEHTPDRTFAFVIFLGPAMPGVGQFKVFCPINDGLGHQEFDVPAEVIDSLPPGGIMVSGQQTHMMAKWNDRRFDLISIECNRSPFSFAM